MTASLNVPACRADGAGKSAHSDVPGRLEFIVNLSPSGASVEFDNWRFIMLSAKWNNLDAGDTRGDSDSLATSCWSTGCGELWRILDFYRIIVHSAIPNSLHPGSRKGDHQAIYGRTVADRERNINPPILISTHYLAGLVQNNTGA